MEPNVPLHPEPADETRTVVTLADFFGLWMRYQRYFFAGLLIVAVATVLWIKLLMTEFFRAETIFNIGSQFTAVSRVGLAELHLFEPNLSDKVLLLQILKAEYWLQSHELLLEVAELLKHPKNPAEGPPVDLYELLRIPAGDQHRRDFLLVKTLNDNLVRCKESQTSGLIQLSVEMPDPRVAARFANACVEALKRRFTAGDFGYLDQAVKLYEKDVPAQVEKHRALSEKLLQLEPYDTNPIIQAQRAVLQSQVNMGAGTLNAMLINVQHLRMATDPRAKDAAQPVQLIEQAWPPLKKSRPQTILTTILVAAVYTFVFMAGLMLVGLLRAGRTEQRPDAPAARGKA
jgi:uncharacterized protein involved in exopolysaccharide biosynthesis